MAPALPAAAPRERAERSARVRTNPERERGEGDEDSGRPDLLRAVADLLRPGEQPADVQRGPPADGGVGGGPSAAARRRSSCGGRPHSGGRRRQEQRTARTGARFHYGDRASGRFVARDELSALSAVRSPWRETPRTHVSRDFFSPTSIWLTLQVFIFFLFIFLFFLLCSISVVIFFSFPVFPFTFYMSEVFLTTFIWKSY